MHTQRYLKVGSPYQYIAAQLGGPFDPLPSWFQLLEKTGILRYDSEHNVEVRVITGAWQTVEYASTTVTDRQQGDWVVLQRAIENGPIGFDQCTVWHVEHEDFIKAWKR